MATAAERRLEDLSKRELAEMHGAKGAGVMGRGKPEDRNRTTEAKGQTRP